MDEYKIFLASPSNRYTDIKVLKNSLLDLSEYTEKEFGIKIIPLTGDDAERGQTRPQGSINKLVNSCDFFIGLVGKELGSPTGVTISGTFEEYIVSATKYELEKRPQIRMYFKTIDKSKLNNVEIAEYRNVEKFKAIIREHNFRDSYSNIEEVISKVHNKIKKFIQQLPEIREFRISSKEVKIGNDITLFYDVIRADLPLKLERLLSDGSAPSEYNLNYLKSSRTDQNVRGDSTYRLTASNKYGKRIKECKVKVINNFENDKPPFIEEITLDIAEIKNTLIESNDIMKEEECNRNAKILFNRINEHLIDFDNERKRNNDSIFIIEYIGKNKDIKNPPSYKSIISHNTVIRSDIYENNKVIITYDMCIRNSTCYLFRALHRYKKGARPQWTLLDNWEMVYSFDANSTQEKTVIDKYFRDSIKKGLKVIKNDIFQQG